VRVIDAASGDDLTQQTLTQIIIEGRGAARLLPVPLLTQLVRLGDDALAEFFGRYVTGALELYLQARRGAQAIAPFNPFAAMPFSASDALARLWMATPMARHAEPGEEPPRQPAAADDVASLRRELDELKKTVRAAASRPGKRRKRRPGSSD
jgi:polyhydroxyalkanoate synthesis regulator protein